jgi:prepilin-type processing-associated H-X9-DG protein
VTGKVRETAKRTRCTGNVRQITALLINWANQDKLQRFPNIASAPNQPVGQSPWDVLRSRTAATPSNQLTLDDLAKNSGPQVMYCPSSRVPDGVDPYRDIAGYAAIDYLLLVGHPGQGPAKIKENNAVPNMFHSDRIRAEYTTVDLQGGGRVAVPPSRRELVVDAVGVSGTSWDAVTANLQKSFTNHVSGKAAAGATIGFVDGHVNWRSVGQMQALSGSSNPVPRTTPFQNVTFVW